MRLPKGGAVAVERLDAGRVLVGRSCCLRARLLSDGAGPAGASDSLSAQRRTAPPCEVRSVVGSLEAARFGCRTASYGHGHLASSQRRKLDGIRISRISQSQTASCQQKVCGRSRQGCFGRPDPCGPEAPSLSSRFDWTYWAWIWRLIPREERRKPSWCRGTNPCP